MNKTIRFMRTLIPPFLSGLILLINLNCSSALAAEVVRIGYLQNDIHQLACWVALDKGFYARQGLDVQVAGIFKAGPELMSAFSAGELDMGYVGEAPATTAVANGAARVQVLAQVNTEGSAIVVGRDSVISGIKDLVGRTLAVPGHSTVQDFMARKALDKAGIDTGQVNIIVIKPPEMIGALRTGQIDAFIAWEPYPAKAVTMDVGRILLASAQIWLDHPCCCLAARTDFIQKHPELALAMVKAHVEATDFIRENPDEAVKIGVKHTGMDEKTIGLAMTNVNYTCEISVEGEREYVSFLSELKYIKVRDPQGWVDEFINSGYLRKATGK